MKVENCSSVSRLPACILSNRLVSYFPKKEAQRYCSERKNKVFLERSLGGMAWGKDMLILAKQKAG